MQAFGNNDHVLSMVETYNLPVMLMVQRPLSQQDKDTARDIVKQGRQIAIKKPFDNAASAGSLARDYNCT